MKRNICIAFLFPILLLIMSLSLAEEAHARQFTLAVLPFENSSGDIRSDYLGKIAEALLMYDLTSLPDIQLVSRDDLDTIMQEKQLSLSGLVEDKTELREIGGLSGADYLVRGEYVHLGDDLLFIVKLISVEDGGVTVLRERGTDENTVHRLSGAIVHELTGRIVEFSSEDGRRSIISLKNEAPGSIALYSPLIDAEVFLDNQFVGYTTGDPTIPFLIQQIRPGPHTVRTHLSRDFGVIDLPDIRFRDWEEETNVRPDQQTVVRDRSRHFNSILYDMQRLLQERLSFDTLEELGRYRNTFSFDFADREGRIRKGSIRIEVRDQSFIDCTLNFGNEKKTRTLPIPTEPGRNEEKITLDLIELETEIEHRFEAWNLSFALTRTDVRQGMHREEYGN